MASSSEGSSLVYLKHLCTACNCYVPACVVRLLSVSDRRTDGFTVDRLVGPIQLQRSALHTRCKIAGIRNLNASCGYAIAYPYHKRRWGFGSSLLGMLFRSIGVLFDWNWLLVCCRIWWYWLHGIRMSMLGRHSVRCSVRFSDVHVCSPRLRQFTDYRSPSHPCRR